MSFVADRCSPWLAAQRERVAALSARADAQPVLVLTELVQNVQKYVIDDIAPLFCDAFGELEKNDVDKVFQFAANLCDLAKSVEEILSMARGLAAADPRALDRSQFPGSVPPLRLLEYILAFVFTEKVPTMDRLVAAYFSLKLKEIESQMEYLDEVSDDWPDDADLTHFIDSCYTLYLYETVNEATLHVISEQIAAKVRVLCGDDFDVSSLAPLLRWLDQVLVKFVEKLSEHSPPRESVRPNWEIEHRKDAWKSDLRIKLLQAFVVERSKQIFDIVVDFPDSEQALLDLGNALNETAQHAKLVAALKAAFRKRLLVPGATTEAILQIYVATIKAIKIIDSSGVLVEAVTAPVAAYLKKRTDAIRCIVGSLTDESEDVLGLYEELRNSSTTLQDALDEDSDEDLENWEPEPLHLLPGEPKSERSKGHDILSMLVNIYGTRELFVNEIAALLGERLLAITDFNIEKELQTVELLKIKFGEHSLSKCEVMLKDMGDSKRVNATIRYNLRNEMHKKPNAVDNESEMLLSATIISSLFWPKLGEDELQLPREINDDMELFKAEFERIKARKLVWHKAQGTVDLTLDFPDGSLDFTATPVQASIIATLQERKEWEPSEICKKIEMKEESLQRHMAFWLQAGVVRLVNGCFVCATRVSETTQHAGATVVDVDETPSPNEAAEAELLGQISQFMAGMLAIHGSMGLDRIHSMFSMVLDGYSVHVQNEAQLARLLERLVADGTLAVNGDQYSLAAE